MLFTKALLRYAAFMLLALILLILTATLWLRHEYARVQLADASGVDWNAVEVKALGTGLPDPLPCQQQYPQKKAWFGALHVHTEASYDSTAFGNLANIDQAYAFGTGKPLPMRLRGDAPETAVPVVTISSPLDFMGVTDHAEEMGERRLCYAKESEAYSALPCKLFRGDIRLPVEESFASIIRLASFAIFGQDRSVQVCGKDGSLCRDMAANVWERNQRSTETWHDRSSDCRFTTFHAYEYTLAEEATNLHRNVVFASNTVPQQALSSKEARKPEQLWEWLDATCIEGNPHCNALAIPHNSNWSSGRMWFPYTNQQLSTAEQKRLAALRAKVEPLVEIMQVKGDSECRNGIASVFGEPDELCDFEKLRVPSEVIPDCGEETGAGGMMLKGCASRYSYVRYALTAGLAEREALGVNPFRLGIVAASDTHNGSPAVGQENNHKGSHGTDRDIQSRLLSKVEVPGDVAAGSPVRFNPGGIAGVYAQENSRKALFSAMRNRETFGTSGPRITPRFFAGWDLSPDICESSTYLETAYAGGVPMGGTLTGQKSHQAGPLFVASANRDPREGANLLQRLQIVKGWIDSEGKTHQAVYDIAGSTGDDKQASVDKASCSVQGPGFSQLCATWRDPQFNPDSQAVYYTRVVENPSCRWSHFDCISLPQEERPESCRDPDLPWQIQERAWTSPIWYEPQA
ncbi:MAG: DUF3604 domain-containing protein [Halioglobus sp.]